MRFGVHTAVRVTVGLIAISACLVSAASPTLDFPKRPRNSTRFFVLRHGQACTNVRGPLPSECQGRREHLTAEGKAKAARAGSALVQQGVTLGVTSSAVRAQETTQELVGVLKGIPTSVDPGISLGASPAAVDATIRTLAGANPGSAIVIVTHNEVISPLLDRVRGPASPRPKEVLNGSVTIIDVAADGTMTISHYPQLPQ
jgi:broad specificity phosphatase PhoE